MSLPRVSHSLMICLCLAVVFGAVSCDGPDDVPGEDPSKPNLDILKTIAGMSACMPESAWRGMGYAYLSFAMLDRTDRANQSTWNRVQVATLDCISGAEDCDAMRTCVSATPQEQTACEGAGNRFQCSGDVLVDCWGYPEETPDVVDCGSAGLVCGEGNDYASCGIRTCNPSLDLPRCEGDLLIACDPYTSTLVADDCSTNATWHCEGINDEFVCGISIGGTCGVSPYGGGVGCVGDEEICEQGFENHCEGSVLVSCRDGRKTRYDCGNGGSEWTCGKSTYAEADCVFTAQECAVLDSERCNEGVVTFCREGHLQELDCKSHGLSDCGEREGPGERTIAFCKP